MAAIGEVKSEKTEGADEGATSLPPTLCDGFWALESLFGAAKRYTYDYTAQDVKASLDISPEKFTTENMKGFHRFLTELQKAMEDPELFEHAVLRKKTCAEYQPFFTALNDLITSFPASTEVLPHVPDAACRETLREQFDKMARIDFKIPAAVIVGAIRRTLRVVNSKEGLGTTRETLPDEVYGQLLSVIMFTKALFRENEKIIEDTDKLMLLTFNAYQYGMQTLENPDAIYYLIQGTYSYHFPKKEAWTTTFRSVFSSVGI